ncbi:5515_t:CDS:2, partial [Dentiscutata erythropus]
CIGLEHISARQPDASFIPSRLSKPSPNPSDAQGNPWPTIVFEVARSQSLANVVQKVNSYSAPASLNSSVTCCKFTNSLHFYSFNISSCILDSVINFVVEQASKQVMHWEDTGQFKCLLNNNYPSLPNKIGGFFQLEFGTISGHGALYNGCSAHGMRTLMIARECAYEGCTPPYPPYPIAGNVVIDLFDIQEAIFSMH